VPKSSLAARLKENIEVFDFELTEEDMRQVSALDRQRRFNDPGVYTPFFNQFYPIFA
jgi:D-xylose reductase